MPLRHNYAKSTYLDQTDYFLTCNSRRISIDLTVLEMFSVTLKIINNLAAKKAFKLQQHVTRLIHCNLI